MSKRVLILVEGQTEERFIKDVLAPYFYTRDLFFYPTILNTKLVKDGPNFKGGVTSYAKFRNDLVRLMQGRSDALVTTLLDYYGLPQDFPGMNTRPSGSPLERVVHVESAIVQDFDSASNFKPFLALHEFEAWLFSSNDELPRVLNDQKKRLAVEKIREAVSSPEEINDRPESAPSKQITALFPAYNKALHGPLAAKRIGLERIRKECPHFNDWIGKLEMFVEG